MKAQVKQHNGTPTLFLDDQPVFADIQLIGGLDPNGIAATQDAIRVYANANVHIYSIDSVGPEWCAPRPGSPARYDFTETAPRLQTILDADPEALFLLRMGFETRFLLENWWNTLNPDEVEVLSDGTAFSASFASLKWQEEVKTFLKDYIDHLRTAGLYDRVIAYQIACGTCGEWIKDWSSMEPRSGDFSPAMRQRFRAWLRRKYQGEPELLQKAWADTQVTFETAEVPSGETQT